MIAVDSAATYESGLSAVSIASVVKVKEAARWFCRVSGFIMLSFLDFMVWGGTGGARKRMVSSMKSWPAMNGDCDCVNEVMVCVFLVMKRSSVV